MNVVDYCFKWNYTDDRPGVPLTEKEAQVRDANGEEYTAVLSTTSGPPVLVTLIWKTGVVVVTFLDEAGRRATEYMFRKKADQELFLTRVHSWTYPSREPGLRLSDTSSHETVHYREDGFVKRVVKDKVNRFQETVEYADVRVDSNWEPVPTFGDYRSVARYDRGLSH